MNIKSRMGKLEQKINLSGKFCQCDENGSGQQRITWTDSHNDVLDDPSAIEAEYCGICKKEINNLVIK